MTVTPIMGPQVGAIYLHMSVGYPTSVVVISRSVITGGKRRAMMIALVLELCGGVCALSTIVFLALASVSKLMPDLERDETAPTVDSDAKCNPVDSIGSSTKSRGFHSERRPSARFPGDEDGSARRNIEPLQ